MYYFTLSMIKNVPMHAKMFHMKAGFFLISITFYVTRGHLALNNLIIKIA